MNINELVHPFNERGKVAEVKKSEPYLILQKLCNNQPISREEKNRMTEAINRNSFFNDSVALLGVRINFRPFLKKFWFKTKYSGHIFEQFAFDKTSLRHNNRYNYPTRVEEIK